MMTMSQTNDNGILIEAVPTRAKLTMRGLVELEGWITAADVGAVLDMLGPHALREGDKTKLPACLYEDDEDGRFELVVGDPDGEKGTFLTVGFDAAEHGELKMVLSEERLARAWRAARDEIVAREEAAQNNQERAAVGLVKAVLQFASGEQGWSPVAAFNEWLNVSGRKGAVGIPALPLAA